MAKAYGHFITVNYRESLRPPRDAAGSSSTTNRRGGAWSSSPARSPGTPRAIKLGLVDKLHLGNLDAERDWGYAKDYVEAMWLMLQRDEPDDYVIATGAAHSVRDCLEIAFDQAGLEVDRHVVIDDSLGARRRSTISLATPPRLVVTLGGSHAPVSSI